MRSTAGWLRWQRSLRVRCTGWSSSSGSRGRGSRWSTQAGGTLVFAAESIGESLEPGLWNGFGISNVIDNVGAYLTRPTAAASGLIRPKPVWRIMDNFR